MNNPTKGLAIPIYNVRRLPAARRGQQDDVTHNDGFENCGVDN